MFKKLKRKKKEIKGFIDLIEEFYLVGWAWNPKKPEERLSVVVYIDGKPLAEGVADQFREDLLKAGIGDGKYGFKIKLPEEVFDGKDHEIVVKVKGKENTVIGKPLIQKLDLGYKIEGNFDGIKGQYAIGWAWNPKKPEERLSVVVYIDGKPLAEGVADQFREDLLKAGIGDGKYGFKIKLPDKVIAKIEKNTSEINRIKIIIKEYNQELKPKGLYIIKNSYLNWIRKYEIPLLEKIRNFPREFYYKPKISIIMPVYNTPEKFLRKAIESVINQIYPNWELCIADDASTHPHVKQVLKEYAEKYKNIKVVFRKKNGHICEASNSALSLVTGDYVGFLDHDDELAPHALYMVVEAINENPNVKIIYSDEDKIDEEGNRFEPHFKSDWNPDLLLSQNYIAHFLVIRRDIIRKIGGFRKGTEGSQDHDIVLRASLHCKESEIVHIPQILYHWREWKGSTAKNPKVKKYTEDTGIKVIKDFLIKKGIKNFEVAKGKFPNTYRVIYQISNPPLVSIIIPTKDQVNLLKKCIYSILNKTDYPNYEIIIVNHESMQEETYKFFKEISRLYDNIKILWFSGEFNFSLINNFASHYAKGDLLLFLNNDTEVINPDWLREMVSHAIRPEIGCVGAKLYYPDGTIQHAGVILGLGGIAGHSHKHFSYKDPGYFRRLHLIQNLSAVTAACLMVKKDVFFEVGGFDANLKVAFNDVDFCLKVREKGYRNLWTPYAELIHHESKSRGYEDTPEKQKRFRKEIEYMKKKWGDLLLRDPYYNPNLTLDREDFSIKD